MCIRDRNCPKHQVIKSKAIEGSSENGAEQLALPILAVAFAMMVSLVAFVGVILGRSWIPALETVKLCLAVSMLFLVLGARTVQSLTFDCRWWGSQHHGNSQKCHDGMALYVSGAVLLFVAQLGITGTVLHFLEHERKLLAQRCYSDL
eukprot:TRINITY_DN14398_c0_g1_i1.p1 TRINITY_DN14398_c0_g1~~TRINITY_DN14398_c0_g1_i1.p1  ORF type:complete len:148 (-),score=31.32 TRINITY_DN14398_c0_g1_i1:84-527(-)